MIDQKAVDAAYKDPVIMGKWIKYTMNRLAAKMDRDVLDAISNMKGNKMDQIIGQIDLISLNIRLWQGKKTLKAEDLASNGIDISKLPPGTLASLGSKKTIGNEATAQFIALKRAAIAKCTQFGIKFGDSTFAIPEEKTQQVCDWLNDVKLTFAESKKGFLDAYVYLTEEWIAQNPIEWRDAIRKSVDSVEDVSNAMSFNFSAYKVKPVDNVFNGFDEELTGLYGQLCKEIRQLAKLTFDTSYAGKLEIGQRALRPIKAMREKIHGLGFLDPALFDIVDRIDIALMNVHKKRVIKGMELDVISGILANTLCHMGKKTLFVAEEEFTEVVEEVVEEEVEAKQIPSIGWDF